MPDLILPNTIDAATPIVASEHQQNYEAIRDTINALDGENLAAALAAILGVTQAGSIRRGYTSIPSEDSRTNAAYGLLANPDRVSNIVVPTGGLLRIAYQARWLESVAGAARAAVFIGANQLKVANYGGAPVTQAAVMATGAGTPSTYTPLHSSNRGLLSAPSRASSTADVTTGQILGAAMTFGTDSLVELGGTVLIQEEFHLDGGEIIVFLDAGTYDVSIQFKASSGTVYARERRLWVESRGF